MPRKFRNILKKRKDSNHRAALHNQQLAHNEQLENLLQVVEETQQVVEKTQLAVSQHLKTHTESCSSSTADSRTNSLQPSSSRRVEITQDDLRTLLNQRARLSQPDDLRKTLNDRKQTGEKRKRED